MRWLPRSRSGLGIKRIFFRYLADKREVLGARKVAELAPPESPGVEAATGSSRRRPARTGAAPPADPGHRSGICITPGSLRARRARPERDPGHTNLQINRRAPGPHSLDAGNARERSRMPTVTAASARSEVAAGTGRGTGGRCCVEVTAVPDVRGCCHRPAPWRAAHACPTGTTPARPAVRRSARGGSWTAGRTGQRGARCLTTT